MPDEDPVPYSELLAMLRGDPLNDFEREAAAELGRRVMPGWGDSTQLHRDLAHSGTSGKFLRACYGEVATPSGVSWSSPPAL